MEMTHEMSLAIRTALNRYKLFLETEIASGLTGGFYETEQLPTVEKALKYFYSSDHISEVVGK